MAKAKPVVFDVTYSTRGFDYCNRYNTRQRGTVRFPERNGEALDKHVMALCNRMFHKTLGHVKPGPTEA